MNQILLSCSKINNTCFPCDIDGVLYESLTHFVHDISRNCYCPFSAFLTSQNRRTVIYSCTFAQDGCNAKLIFNIFTNFNDVHYYTFNLQDSVLVHNNHLLDNHFVQAHRNCCSESQCDQIRFQTQLGVPPGRIRSNLDIQCGSNLFYNIRRPTIEESRSEDLDSLIEKLQSGREKLIKVNKDDDGILNSITVIDSEILNSNYSEDVAIIDDTVMTNLYGLPVEAIVVIDAEGHSQLLAYSLLPNKTEDSFSAFFGDYLELGGHQFRIIIVDRLQAQFNSLSKKFPRSVIVFCLFHIRNDLLLYFSRDDPIIIGFDNAVTNPSQSDTYLHYLIHRRSQMKNECGIKCLDNLIEHYTNWLPSCLLQQGVFYSFYSSRIEGLFGLLKGNYGHERGNLMTVINNLNNLCGVFKTQSYTTYKKTSEQYLKFPLIEPSQINICGRLLLGFLEEEFNAFVLHIPIDICVWCHLRSNNSPYTIPCRHTIQNGYTINLNQIHKRFLRNFNIFQPIPNVIQISESAIPHVKNRTNLLARIEPYSNLYGRNSEVDRIFDSALTDLENLKVRRNAGMPPTIAQSGAAFCHPSHNVLCGRQSTKRKRHCSHCKSTGYDIRNCPYILAQ